MAHKPLPTVNRSLLTLLPQEPFAEWANAHPALLPEEKENPYTVEAFAEQPNVYLIPEVVDEEDFADYLEQNWKLLFEHELGSWFEDPATWPKDLSFEMFVEWFNLAYTSMIFDLPNKAALGYSDY